MLRKKPKPSAEIRYHRADRNSRTLQFHALTGFGERGGRNIHRNIRDP